MSKLTKSHLSRSGELTRPDITLEEEAEICGMDVHQVRQWREALDEVSPGSDYERLWDSYVKLTSITVDEAAVMSSCPPEIFKKLIDRGVYKYFIHRGRRRIWLADFENRKTRHSEVE